MTFTLCEGGISWIGYDLTSTCFPVVYLLYIKIQGDTPDKLCIFHAEEKIHVFSMLAKSVAKEEKKENPYPKHPI